MHIYIIASIVIALEFSAMAFFIVLIRMNRTVGRE